MAVLARAWPALGGGIPGEGAGIYGDTAGHRGMYGVMVGGTASTESNTESLVGRVRWAEETAGDPPHPLWVHRRVVDH